MKAETIEIIAQVAGIGGIAVGGMVLIFRDVIRRNIFPMLTKKHSFELIRLIVILSFLMALAGIGAWLISTQFAPRSDSSGLSSLPLIRQQVVLAARAQIQKAESAAEFANDAAEEAERAAKRARDKEPYTKIDENKDYRYEGEWSNDSPNGFGILRYVFPEALGETFSGNFKDGQRIRGVYIYPPSYPIYLLPDMPPHPYGGALRYEGEWSETPKFPGGNWNGYGKVTYRDGSVYQGQILDGAFSGYGVLHRTDRTRIEGKWEDGNPVEGQYVKWSEDGLPLN